MPLPLLPQALKMTIKVFCFFQMNLNEFRCINAFNMFASIQFITYKNLWFLQSSRRYANYNIIQSEWASIIYNTALVKNNLMSPIFWHISRGLFKNVCVRVFSNWKYPSNLPSHTWLYLLYLPNKSDSNCYFCEW